MGGSQKAYELLELLLDPDATEGDEATVLNAGALQCIACTSHILFRVA